MLTAWTNFAKYSDPNGDLTSNSSPVASDLGWEPCTTEKPHFMRFKLDEKDAEASDMGEFLVDENK